MLTKLSRIFGLAGSALALLAIVYYFIRLIYSPGEVLFDWEGPPYSVSIADAIPILIAAMGLIGSFFVRKKPVLAAVLMIVSGTLVFPFFVISLPPFSPYLIAFIPMLLLTTAGVLALTGRYGSVHKLRNEEPGSSGAEGPAH